MPSRAYNFRFLMRDIPTFSTVFYPQFASMVPNGSVSRQLCHVYPSKDVLVDLEPYFEAQNHDFPKYIRFSYVFFAKMAVQGRENTTHTRPSLATG